MNVVSLKNLKISGIFLLCLACTPTEPLPHTEAGRAFGPVGDLQVLWFTDTNTQPLTTNKGRTNLVPQSKILYDVQALIQELGHSNIQVRVEDQIVEISGDLNEAESLLLVNELKGVFGVRDVQIREEAM